MGRPMGLPRRLALARATGVNGDTRESLFFNNCYWVYNLQTAARRRRGFGKNRGRPGLSGTAPRPCAAPSTPPSSIPLTTAMSTDSRLPGHCPAGRTSPGPFAQRRMAAAGKGNSGQPRGHIHAGITGGAFLFKTLLENNRSDLLYTMVSQQDYPGWGDMLNAGPQPSGKIGSTASPAFIAHIFMSGAVPSRSRAASVIPRPGASSNS